MGSTSQLTARLTEMLRANTYDASSKKIAIDPLRAEAFEAHVAHYA